LRNTERKQSLIAEIVEMSLLVEALIYFISQ